MQGICYRQLVLYYTDLKALLSRDWIFYKFGYFRYPSDWCYTQFRLHLQLWYKRGAFHSSSEVCEIFIKTKGFPRNSYEHNKFPAKVYEISKEWNAPWIWTPNNDNDYLKNVYLNLKNSTDPSVHVFLIVRASVSAGKGYTRMNIAENGEKVDRNKSFSKGMKIQCLGYVYLLSGPHFRVKPYLKGDEFILNYRYHHYHRHHRNHHNIVIFNDKTTKKFNQNHRHR